uniref:Reverse transcriptase domain-containing protein n=1 Tax=Macrostomum lignano TaxID=282301 RepID=A0A1I8F4S7_9PLAT
MRSAFRYQIVREDLVASGLRARSGADHTAARGARRGVAADSGDTASRDRVVVLFCVRCDSLSPCARRRLLTAASEPTCASGAAALPRQAPPPVDKPTDLLELAAGRERPRQLDRPVAASRPPQPQHVHGAVPELPRQHHRQSAACRSRSFSPLSPSVAAARVRRAFNRLLKIGGLRPSADSGSERERALARDRLAHRNLACAVVRERPAGRVGDQLLPHSAAAHPDVGGGPGSSRLWSRRLHYELRLPKRSGVVYAARRHETILPSGQRAGYLLGEGPGHAAKRRVLAALLYENYLRGRSAPCGCSVLTTCGADRHRSARPAPHEVRQDQQRMRTSHPQGLHLCHLRLPNVRVRQRRQQVQDPPKAAATSTTWAGSSKASHHPGTNAPAPKTCTQPGRRSPVRLARLCWTLQIPAAHGAGCVRISATGPREPKNMGYMTPRLGCWGSGQRLSPLSPRVCQFGIDEVPCAKSTQRCTTPAAQLWQQAKSAFEEASKRTIRAVEIARWCGASSGPLISDFFKHLCVSAKIDRCVELATEAVEAGHCVVIGLQSTGEARTTEMLEEAQGDLSDFVSTAKGSLVESTFRAWTCRSWTCSRVDDTIARSWAVGWFGSIGLPAGDGAGSGSESGAARRRAKSPARSATGGAAEADLLRAVEALDEQLPKNALDELIDRLAAPSGAEMTGRRGRVVADDAGQVTYESRRETELSMELINLTEKQRFMDGDKLIAVISEAASSGISLQFGAPTAPTRCRRPRYVFLISELAGERRFAASVAKRLESLGALTHGDRRAGESRDLSPLQPGQPVRPPGPGDGGQVSHCMEEPIAEVPVDLWFDFPQALVSMGMVGKQPNGYYLDREYNYIPKFLNRLLGLEVALQNALFQYFCRHSGRGDAEAKREGKLDIGMPTWASRGEFCRSKTPESYETRYFGDCCQVHLHTVRAERGLSWHRASEIFYLHERPHDGFYLPKQAAASGLKQPLLAVAPSRKQRNKRRRLEGGGSSSTAADEAAALMRLYSRAPGSRPGWRTSSACRSAGSGRRTWSWSSGCGAVIRHWPPAQVYERSRSQCAHAISSASGLCGRQAATGKPCEVGLRVRVYHLLAGSVPERLANTGAGLPQTCSWCACGPAMASGLWSPGAPSLWDLFT